MRSAPVEHQRGGERPAAGLRRPRSRPRGRFCRRPPEISAVEPPPSRLIACSQPRATISRASSTSVRPASWRERPSHATATMRPSARPSAARGWRPSVGVGVELVRRRRGSPRRRRRGRTRRRRPRHEQRPGLQQVAARLGRRSAVAARDPRDAALDVHAGAHRVPRRGRTATCSRTTPCVRTSPSGARPGARRSRRRAPRRRRGARTTARGAPGRGTRRRGSPCARRRGRRRGSSSGRPRPAGGRTLAQGARFSCGCSPGGRNPRLAMRP